MACALWTRPAVRALIEHECGVVLPIRVVGNYLQRWGMSPQKPIKRAYEHSAPVVKRWLERTYPGLAERARAAGAEIHWGEVAAVVSAAVRGRGYAPRGETPIAEVVGGTREKLSMISTVTNQCKARWMIIEGAFTGDRLIEFFAALIKDAPRKVFIILDNLGVHHCPPVKAWLGEHTGQIEAFYRPGSELNSDECRLNAGLRHALGARVAVRNPSHTQGREPHRRGDPARCPERIRAYFGDLRVK
jgi:hypothetical protein